MGSSSPGPEMGSENEEIHFEEVHIEPWPDGRRVRVHVNLSPFEKHPNLEAVLFSSSGEEISRLYIIETPENKLVFTMHLRGVEIPGTFLLKIKVYILEEAILDERQLQFYVEETNNNS